MNRKIFKPMMLALAGAVALAGAGAAHAAEVYVVYKGETTLSTPSAQANCWTTLAGTIDDMGNVVVKAVGARPGDPACAAIYTGNIAWTGAMSSTGTGSGTISINTDANGTGAPSTIIPATGDSCYGVITGTAYPAANDPESDGVNTPTEVTISGSGNYGSCTITGTLTRRQPH